MIRPLECFIGLRYLSTGRGRGLVSFMSAASLIGIALGVASIIVILSAMNGLEDESRVRLLSMAEHITVRPADPDADLGSLRSTLAAVEGVQAVTPFVRLEGILRKGARGTRYRGVLVRGIDPEAERGGGIADVIGAADLESLAAGSNNILLGRFVAAELGALRGDPLEIILADVRDGRVEPLRGNVTMAGDFSAGSEVHDSGLALMNLEDAARVAGRTIRPEGLAIRLVEPMAVESVERRLRESIGPGFDWSNWATENRSLYRAMAIEKTMMTVLLMFVVAVAGFNIVTSLTMVVNEKQKDIAILRTLGLESRRVMRVFLVQGAAIGLAGVVTGLVIGLSLALNLETILPWLEQTFGFRVMPGDVFYVNEVPSRVRVLDLLLIPGSAFLIALAATIWPSRRAARVDPAEALRYE